MTTVTPIEVAQLLEAHGRDLPRNAAGLFVCMGTVPPTELTQAEYESGLKVIALRDRLRESGERG